MTHLYKEARVCECGYNTLDRSNWNKHQKNCKAITRENDVRADLKKENADLHQQLATKDQQLSSMVQQLAVKGQQIDELIQQLKRENTHLRKSNDARNKRMKMPEPKRRKIAARQEWKCANPYGKCALKDFILEEYDVDHIRPLSQGGADDASNMQALCPACHRRKTENDQHQIRPIENITA